MQQELYQLRLGRSYDVIHGSRLLALRRRDSDRRRVWHRIRSLFGGGSR